MGDALACCASREDPEPEEPPSGLLSAIKHRRCVAVLGPEFNGEEQTMSPLDLMLQVAKAGHAEDKGLKIPRMNEVKRMSTDERLKLRLDIVKCIGKHRTAEYAKKKVTGKSVVPEMRMRIDKLHLIPFCFVLTQDWDDMLDKHSVYTKVLPNDVNDYTDFFKVLRASYSDERRKKVLKFEGEPSTEKTFLIDGEAYEQVRDLSPEDAPNGGQAFLQELLTTHTVLFLGCDLDGGYLGKALEEAHKSGKMKPAYSPGPLIPEEKRKQLFSKYGVQHIERNYGNWIGRLDAMDEFLMELGKVHHI